MRLALILALVALPAAAQLPLPVRDRVTSSQLLGVDSAGRLAVNMVDRNGTAHTSADDGRLDVARDIPVWWDRMQGSAVALKNKWELSAVGMTTTQGSGALTLNAGSDLVSGDYTGLTSVPDFHPGGASPLYLKIRATPKPMTNANLELGFGNAVAATAPTDGVLFRWTGTALACVLNTGGTETTAAFTTTPTTTVYSTFDVSVTDTRVFCRWYTPSTGATETQSITLPSTVAKPTVEGVSVLARVVNTGVPAAAAQLLLGDVTVLQKVLEETRDSAMAHIVAGGSIAFNPVTGLETNTFTTSAVTPSTTVPSFTALGGRYGLSSQAGGTSDYVIMAYQVPTSYRLVITGVSVSVYQSVTGLSATTYEWGLEVQSTGASPTTTDATTATPTTAPRRIALGSTALPATAVVGDMAPEVYRKFSSPLVVDSGRYVHIVAQETVGALTANTVRGIVFISGYFEQQ